MRNAGRGALVAMLALYVIWSTTYLAIKVGLEAGLPPAAFVAMRSLAAGAIMLAVARARGGSIRFSPREFRVTAVVGILLLVGGQYGTFLAEERISSGLASLIVALSPLWIALAESFFPDMPTPSRRVKAGLAIGFAGLLVLVAPQLFDAGAAHIDLIGVGMQLTGTLLWAGGSIYSKRNPLRVDGFAATGWQMVLAGLVLAAIATVGGEWSLVSFTPSGFAALAYLVVFGSCIAFSAFGYALERLPASTVATYTYVNPGIAVMVGWAAGRLGLVEPETVSGWMLAGMAVVLAGVVLTTSGAKPGVIRPAASGPDDIDVTDELPGEAV